MNEWTRKNCFLRLITLILMLVLILPQAVLADEHEIAEDIYVITLEPTIIDEETAMLKGNVVQTLGVRMERGFLISTRLPLDDPDQSSQLIEHVIGVDALGEYEMLIDGLRPGTTYYVRAFLMNEGYMFGEIKTFTTPGAFEEQPPDEDPNPTIVPTPPADESTQQDEDPAPAVEETPPAEEPVVTEQDEGEAPVAEVDAKDAAEAATQETIPETGDKNMQPLLFVILIMSTMGLCIQASYKSLSKRKK